MSNELQKFTKHEISNEEIQRLFPKVNDGSRWHVDVNTWQFVDAIIEEWFEQRGVTFWDMPEIEQWELVGDPITIVLYCS